MYTDGAGGKIRSTARWQIPYNFDAHEALQSGLTFLDQVRLPHDSDYIAVRRVGAADRERRGLVTPGFREKLKAVPREQITAIDKYSLYNFGGFVLWRGADIADPRWHGTFTFGWESPRSDTDRHGKIAQHVAELNATTTSTLDVNAQWIIKRSLI